MDWLSRFLFANFLLWSCRDAGATESGSVRRLRWSSEQVLTQASEDIHHGSSISWWKNPVPGAHVTTDRAALPTLTPRGERIRRVLIYGMVGGICRTDDWRGDLPKYIMKYLPQARGVILMLIPNYADLSVDPQVRCSECTVDGKQVWDRNRFCDHYLGEKVTEPADLLLLFGSGRLERWSHATHNDRWPDMHNLFNSSYINKDTMIVHLPVRKAKELRTLFPADFTVQDEDFVKPLSLESYHQMKELCPEQEKTNTLLYVGRYKEGKGQLAFLTLVDPRDLEGYTIHFYGSDINASKGAYWKQLEDLARQRGISVVLHEPVPKTTVLTEYCKAAGIIHYSSGDNNPRVLYEALYGEIPIFTTPETLLSDIMYEQEFVTSVSALKPDEFHGAFRRFMHQVRNGDEIGPRIRSFVDDVLNPDNVYRRLCVKMGICHEEAIKTVATYL